MTDNELKHYGVPGMRWGHRKKIVETQRERAHAKEDRVGEKEHDDYKRTVERKGLKAMSTAEIQQVNNRIQAENQFRELNKSKFQKAAEEVLGNVAKSSATRFLNHYAHGAVDMVTNMIDQTPIAKLFGTYKGDDGPGFENPLKGLFKKKESDDNNADENKNQTNNNQSDNKNQQKQNKNQPDNKNQQKQNTNQTDDKNDKPNDKPTEGTPIKLKTREDDVKVADPTEKTREDKILAENHKRYQKYNAEQDRKETEKRREAEEQEKKELEAKIKENEELFSPKAKISGMSDGLHKKKKK